MRVDRPRLARRAVAPQPTLHRAATAHDPYAAWRIVNYRSYLSGALLSSLGRQAIGLATTWQIYRWTHSATALGLAGLINVLPVLALSIPAGALADRFDRRLVIKCGARISAAIGLALAAIACWHDAVPPLLPLRWANGELRRVALIFERHVDPATLHFDAPALPLLLVLLLAFAAVRILVRPSRSSITPLLVPDSAINNAVAWDTSATQITTVAGPALGGFLIAVGGFASVYVCAAAFDFLFGLLLQRVHYFRAPVRPTGHSAWRDTMAGARFIWSRKVILGASTLDLFAVLCGGATALLPVYADQVLHIGPIGFGWLRAAPSIGAVAMALGIAHSRPMARPGRAILVAVTGFGGAIMVFGWSHTYWLSFAALVTAGACDNVSVVVRQLFVQMLSPDSLRGRVSAVTQMFSGSSNEIGALRAGLMAALIGPVGAVVIGGAATVAVAAIVAVWGVSLRKQGALYSVVTDE